MSFTIEYVVAEQSQAKTLLRERDRDASRQTIMLDPVDPFSLVALATVLELRPGAGRNYDVDSYLPEIASDGVHGPWVLVTPNTLVTKIAAIQDSDVPKIAFRWHKENRAWDDIPIKSGDVEKILHLLRRICRSAVEAQKPLLICLMP